MGVPSKDEQEELHLLFEKNRETIQDTIDSRVGQIILVEVNYDNHEGHTEFGRRGHITTRTDLSVGVSTGKTKSPQAHRGIIVPMRYHACFNGWNRRWQRQKGSIEIGPLDIPNLGKTHQFRTLDASAHYGMRSLPRSLDIIAGDLDFAAHFSVRYDTLQENYASLRNARREGRLADKDLKQRIIKANTVDWQYILLTNMFGVKMLPELKGPATKLKEGIVRAIYENRDTKAHLDEAIQLGMHETPARVVFEGEGITVNVPEYIRKKCQDCGVKIPK